MTMFAIQTIVVLLLAFAAGCVTGCLMAGMIGRGAEREHRGTRPARARPAARKLPPVADKPAAAKSTGKRDDLKLLSGVGPVLEKKLNKLGVARFAQIAAWDKADIAAFDSKLNFKGRIEREKWVSQAEVLAKGGETEFSKRAGKGGGAAGP